MPSKTSRRRGLMFKSKYSSFFCLFSVLMARFRSVKRATRRSIKHERRCHIEGREFEEPIYTFSLTLLPNLCAVNIGGLNIPPLISFQNFPDARWECIRSARRSPSSICPGAEMHIWPLHALIDLILCQRAPYFTECDDKHLF